MFIHVCPGLENLMTVPLNNTVYVVTDGEMGTENQRTYGRVTVHFHVTILLQRNYKF